MHLRTVNTFDTIKNRNFRSIKGTNFGALNDYPMACARRPDLEADLLVLGKTTSSRCTAIPLGVYISIGEAVAQTCDRLIKLNRNKP